MRLLFVMRHEGYVRNFESTVRLLCDRGHQVHLGFQTKVKYEQLDPTDIAGQLAAQYPTFSYGEMPIRTDAWALLGRELRLGLDYLRYLEPEYDEAPKLRERAQREAPPVMLEAEALGKLRGTLSRRLLALRNRAMNRAIPRDPDIDAFLQKMRPDVLAVTPLIEPGAPQSEYLRSARALGIRTVHCVASWDNLTNKGLIHGPVDLVTVWNDAMKREAMQAHGIPASHVAVTGAAAFDHWFQWRPSTTREEFCRRAGLPADRPYLLYVCSSKFVAPVEVPFVRTWIQELRRCASPRLREAGVLIRAHPQNAEQWATADLRGLGAVALFPRAATAPVDVATRSDYFDSIHHSAAVVGINTTAEIESAIIGRGVYTVLTPEFRDTQEGTLHFHHLQRGNGGLLHVARSFDEHFTQLDETVQRPQADDPRCRPFVEAFVRPYGTDVAATPRLVEAIERVAARPARRQGDSTWAPLVRGRLQQRAEELMRSAEEEPQSYAARLAAKAAREVKRRAREVDRAKRLRDKARQEADRENARLDANEVGRTRRLEGLVIDFQKMGEVDRRNFLRAIQAEIPLDSYIELQAANKPRRLDYEQADIYLRVTSKTESFRVKACAKEPFTIDWIHRIGAGEVLYDIGANVGAYSMVAAKKPGGGARVYAFEASYRNIDALCANIAVNGVSTDVVPMPVALSGETGMTTFNLRDLDSGAARHGLGDRPPEDGPVVLQQPVMMYRLDELVERFKLPLPNHVKLDVDGGELAVLEGAAQTLQSPSLKSLLVEVTASLSEPVSAALNRYGLRLESKFDVTNKAGELGVWYGLFVPDGDTR